MTLENYKGYNELTKEQKQGIEHYYSCSLKKNKCYNCKEIEPTILKLMGFK